MGNEFYDTCDYQISCTFKYYKESNMWHAVKCFSSCYYTY